MSLVAPFTGLRPAPGRAAEVLAPPYDVLDRDEAAALAAGRPCSFLHLSRAEIGLAPDLDPHDPAVYARAAAKFAELCAGGVLVRDPRSCYYVWRLSRGDHTQTGVVVAAALDAYRTGRIRRHELTLAEKEDDRLRQIAALGAQTGPAYLIHLPDPVIDETLARAAEGEPAVDCTIAGGDWDGVRHQLWVLSDPAAVARLTGAFEAQERLYIADGHHRSAAAARVAAQAPPGPGAAGGRFLAVSFPADQLRVLAVHRLVADLAGRNPLAFLHELATCGTLVPSREPVAPVRPGEFGVYLNRAWYRLILAPDPDPADPAAVLDVRLLQDRVLAPLLGIEDPRADPRLGFVGGARGLKGLTAQVDCGDWRLGIALHPAALSDLFAIADAGVVMPPKCTWFEPKLADGMVSLLLDDACRRESA